MEKLKAKHDHSLTDILKVLIFSLFLLIPGIMFLPSMLYFGFNHEANAPVKEVQVQENLKVDFNQKYICTDYTYTRNGVTFTRNAETQYICVYGTNDSLINYPQLIKISNQVQNHKYYFKYTGIKEGISWLWQVYNNDTFIANKNFWTPNEYIYIFNDINANASSFVPYQATTNININVEGRINIYDLTQMFGEGNEPSIAEFNALFPNSYYEYTESQEMILTVDGPTEQVIDITTQLEWNWEQIWQRPILSWTKYSILKQGLDAFTNVFGVLQTSYITNLIAYELIMVAIYIVIDIVISIFKWLTHLIGTK